MGFFRELVRAREIELQRLGFRYRVGGKKGKTK